MYQLKSVGNVGFEMLLRTFCKCEVSNTRTVCIFPLLFSFFSSLRIFFSYFWKNKKVKSCLRCLFWFDVICQYVCVCVFVAKHRGINTHTNWQLFLHILLREQWSHADQNEITFTCINACLNSLCFFFSFVSFLFYNWKS